MSATTIVRVFCDGLRFRPIGSSCPDADRTIDTWSVSEARAKLKAQGWTRRHHQDTLVDLCAFCSPRAEIVPPVFKGGRPRKVRDE